MFGIIQYKLRSVLRIQIQLDPYNIGSPGSGSEYYIGTDPDPAACKLLAICNLFNFFNF